MSADDLPGYIRVDDIEPGTSAETLMEDLRRRPPIGTETLWLVISEGGISREAQVWLNAGVSETLGMLEWVDRMGYWVPSGRYSNLDRSGFINFRHASGVVLPFPAVFAAPVPLVYEAIQQVLNTKKRPTCVEWEFHKPPR